MAKKTSRKQTSRAKAGRTKAGATARKKSPTPKARKSGKMRSAAAKTAKPATDTKRASKSSKGPSPARVSRKKPGAAETKTNRSQPAARGERKLTRRELEQFREMLLHKRAEILGDVSTLHNEALNRNRQEATGDLSSMPIHMADLGTDNYELEFTLGLIEGERAILKEIDEALERIEKGEYGFCQATGKPIGKARLKARPWAKFCYEYSLAQERGQTGRF